MSRIYEILPILSALGIVFGLATAIFVGYGRYRTLMVERKLLLLVSDMEPVHGLRIESSKRFSVLQTMLELMEVGKSSKDDLQNIIAELAGYSEDYQRVIDRAERIRAATAESDDEVVKTVRQFSANLIADMLVQKGILDELLVRAQAILAISGGAKRSSEISATE